MRTKIGEVSLKIRTDGMWCSVTHDTQSRNLLIKKSFCLQRQMVQREVNPREAKQTVGLSVGKSTSLCSEKGGK